MMTMTVYSTLNHNPNEAKSIMECIREMKLTFVVFANLSLIPFSIKEKMGEGCRQEREMRGGKGESRVPPWPREGG